MKKFFNALFNSKKNELNLKPTMILKCNNVLADGKQKELEEEFSKKLNANVVILDARFSGNVEIFYK